MANAEVATQVTISNDIAEPPMFKVIYLNDNQTTMEFVVDTLLNFFDYTAEGAVKVTQDIHEVGSAVVAVLPFEIAEQKGIEVSVYARTQKFPLQIKLEPEGS
jgi:ATP-dependent Clp protease adaptor protein ClpS